MISALPLNACIAYGEKAKTAAISVASNKQIALYNARITNKTGASVNAGILRKFAEGAGKYKIYTKVGSVYADVTSAIAAGTSTQVVDTTNNDGFIVMAERKFGLIGLTISNTATGGTYTFQYHNGSSWVTLTTIENFSNFNSTGDVYVVFMAPYDWQEGDASATSIDQSMYGIRILHSTAPADAGNINDLWIGEFLEYFEGLGDNSMGQILFDSQVPFVLEGGESIIPYFGTVNAQNQFAAFYSQME